MSINEIADRLNKKHYRLGTSLLAMVDMCENGRNSDYLDGYTHALYMADVITDEEKYIIRNHCKRRVYVVASAYTGIPYRSQEYMTESECEEWIRRDMEENKQLGLNPSREDYEIQDHSEFIKEA